MNETINLLKSHRSYRHFDESYEIPTEDLQQILDASRQAPSWMNGQMYSIIVLKDRTLRQKLVDLNPGNPQMLKSSLFLVFVADLKRTQQIAVEHQANYLVADGLNSLITATTDASLAMQNAIIACEALGLGTVPVGSVRNNIAEVSELLQLPDYTYPLCGLAIGKPIVEMKIKPRLPQEAVVHYDTYKPYEPSFIKEYQTTMELFAEARETKTWTKKFADYFSQKPLASVDQYLRNQKLIK